ncbi:hypothetical protein HMPREF0433_00891 [Gemella sanguinis M325]|uniref:hypothetical protein n=1 Tax=Gemella sanguinis TaxID=84135 RepID=UPI000206D72D|nr:hypothetical protein [Gemella sanguinis]EGF87706.1 hypothetical protein HMPREF0433_00891 [Gemella sanguinis M325]
MWFNLNNEDKQNYKLLITNFASLSEAFSQKKEYEESEDFVAPIINSKFQETVFQKSFNAFGEDISNTSYDASIILDEKNKYLVGIKSFGISSGDQKIAQFKSDSQSRGWIDKFNTIRDNSQNAKTKEENDSINNNYYYELAKEISLLRNKRIASSKEQLKGFIYDDVTVKSVYHVLMPSKKGENPKIYVGEIDYLPIDIENIEIEGATSLKTPTNFKFNDGKHFYKYTSADSQLYMNFKNKDIVLEEWELEYVKDPFYIFENLHLLSRKSEENKILQTVSWMIANKDGKVEESSGFNAFDGSSKIGKSSREKRIKKVEKYLKGNFCIEDSNFIIDILKKILIENNKTAEKKELRFKLINYIKNLNDDYLKYEIEKMVYRPVGEVYIPIPDSKNFHKNFPDFFAKDAGKLEEGKSSLVLSKEKRTFKLKFISSGNVIDAYINQDAGKAIQSIDRQDILGEWLLRGVFQLKERELLTAERLAELHINAIRFTKYVDTDVIGIEFIWIDENNPPEDAIGWVAKNKILDINEISANKKSNNNKHLKIAENTDESDYFC